MTARWQPRTSRAGWRTAGNEGFKPPYGPARLTNHDEAIAGYRFDAHRAAWGQCLAGDLRTEEASFESHGATLSGTIVFPEGKTHAAVVFVHGSGKQGRNLHWAEKFAQEGIAALVHDKRGAAARTQKYIWPGFLGKDTDSSENLAKLSIPGLWIFSDNDPSIPVDLSISKLQTLRKRGHAYDYVLFSGFGHNNMDGTFFVATEWIRRQATAGVPNSARAE